MARLQDTRLPKCVMFGELGEGAGCVGGQEKEWVECFLDDLRTFGINADQRMTAAQNEGGWRRTAEQGADRFLAKWIAAEKARAGLRHAVVCLNVMGRTKERIVQSKWAGASSLAIVDYCSHKWRELVSSERMSRCRSLALRYICLFLFRFRPFCFYQSRGK